MNLGLLLAVGGSHVVMRHVEPEGADVDAVVHHGLVDRELVGLGLVITHPLNVLAGEAAVADVARKDGQRRPRLLALRTVC